MKMHKYKSCTHTVHIVIHTSPSDPAVWWPVQACTVLAPRPGETAVSGRRSRQDNSALWWTRRKAFQFKEAQKWSAVVLFIYDAWGLRSQSARERFVTVLLPSEDAILWLSCFIWRKAPTGIEMCATIGCCFTFHQSCASAKKSDDTFVFALLAVNHPTTTLFTESLVAGSAVYSVPSLGT